MKTLLLMTTLTFMTSSFADDGELFEVYGGGYKMSCESARNNSNELIRAGQWQNIVEAAQIAKSKCEEATGRLCGLITIGDRMRQEELGYMVCRSYAVAKPF